MKNNFIYNSEFSNIYERPNINSNVSTQILFGENFSILKKSRNFYKIKIDTDNVQEINKRILKMTEAEIITKFRGIDPKRASTITSGIFLLEIILSHYSNSPIIISKNDILEGLILKKY